MSLFEPHTMSRALDSAFTTPSPPPRCEYAPTSLLASQVGPAPPHVIYDASARTVTVTLYLVPGTNLKGYFPYFLATPNHDPVLMAIDGPFSPAEAVRRFGVEPVETAGEYWTLTAALPVAAPFAVYFDEIWLGTEASSNRPCRSVYRRLVTSKAEGPELENERGSTGMLPFIRLIRPVSTETLMSLDVPSPIILRTLDLGSAVQTAVTFRASAFPMHREVDIGGRLDTRRAFDVAFTTRGPAPANLQYRYVIGRGNGSELVFERFGWAVGDAVAGNDTIRAQDCSPSNGSCLVRLDAGYGSFVTLRINRSGDLVQVADATR